MKIVVTGKGGVGKTTITSLLAHTLVEKGYKVLAIDEDPQMNLPLTLGLSFLQSNNVVPLNSASEYIEEKTGVKPNSKWGAFFKLNPDVSDVIDRFGIKINDNLGLLVMGTVKKAAAGCLCPENVLLERVMDHISLLEDQTIIMDTQAGVEHFGRAIAKGFTHCIIVVEPSFNAMLVAQYTAKLAKELDIPCVYLLINKITEKNRNKVKKITKSASINLDDLFYKTFYMPYYEDIYNNEPDITKSLQVDNELHSNISLLIEEIIESNNAIKANGRQL